MIVAQANKPVDYGHNHVCGECEILYAGRKKPIGTIQQLKQMQNYQLYLFAIVATDAVA